ncbi:MAG: hypothetical protein KAT91_00125 [Candidatus Aenigmarchaeota archaeon]|nr:hypothetical protein [Candidatus Aenigmarchaeota archaeon]
MIAKIINLFVPVKKVRSGGNKRILRASKPVRPVHHTNKQEKYAKIYAFLEQHKNSIIMVVFLLLAVVFFSNFLVSASFIAVGIASRYYQKYLPHLSLGIETCLFGAVITSLAFGWYTGALVGIISLTISVFLTQEEAHYLPVALAGMAAVAYMASIAPITAANLVFWGVLLTVFYDVATCAVYIYVFKADIFKTLIFIVSHIAFNYFVFSTFGSYILGLLL